MQFKNVNFNYVILFLICLWLILSGLFILFTKFEKVITIKAKEGYGMRNGRGQLVTDETGGVYTVSNAFLIFHFTSAEVFGSLEVGKKYRVKGYGMRIPPIGMFPNITGII